MDEGGMQMEGLVYASKEYSPKECLDVGSGIATWLGTEKIIVTGRDGKPVSRYARRALIVGLAACGVSSLDMRMISSKVLRYEIQKMNVEAGVYVSYFESNIQVHVYNEKGENIPEAEVQKIKNIIGKGEFTKSSLTELGSSSYYPNALEDYISKITEEINFKKPMKILIDCQGDPISSVVSPLFEKYEIKTVLFNDFLSGYDFPKGREEFLKQLMAGKFELGVRFERDDTKGIEIINGDRTSHVDTMEQLLSYIRERKK